MKLNYDMTERDVWNFYFFLWFRRNKLRGLVIGIIGLALLLNIIYRLIFWSPDQWKLLVVFIAVPALLILSQVYVVKVKLPRMGFYGRYEFVAGEEGFMLQSPKGGMEQNEWSKLGEVRETNEYYFLFYHGNGAFVLPKRAFASKADEQAFLEKVKGLLHA